MTVLDDVQAVPVAFLELELTRRCQRTCSRCCSNSGPAAGTGDMTTGDWLRVVAEASVSGIDTVQLIGGEPIGHPDVLTIARYALGRALRVAVYSNLVEVAEPAWAVYEDARVTLSTSWYTGDPAQHRRVTRNPDAYDKTLSNIRQVVRRGIRLKVGVVTGIIPGQRAEEAVEQLREIGVTNLVLDKSRPVRRASPGRNPELTDLCGRCGNDRAAIDNNGKLAPCVPGRHLIADDIRKEGVGAILNGSDWRDVIDQIPRGGTAVCDPACNPSQDGNDCAPAEQTDGK